MSVTIKTFKFDGGIVKQIRAHVIDEDGNPRIFQLFNVWREHGHYQTDGPTPNWHDTMAQVKQSALDYFHKEIVPNM